jgi:hypothetical protein
LPAGALCSLVSPASASSLSASAGSRTAAPPTRSPTSAILFKTIDEIELYRIKDVRLGYSLLNQMADIGTIILTSSDRTTAGGEFTLRNIPMARDRREGLRKLVDRARQRRGVRELDVDDAYALD